MIILMYAAWLQHSTIEYFEQWITIKFPRCFICWLFTACFVFISIWSKNNWWQKLNLNGKLFQVRAARLRWIWIFATWKIYKSLSTVYSLAHKWPIRCTVWANHANKSKSLNQLDDFEFKCTDLGEGWSERERGTLHHIIIAYQPFKLTITPWHRILDWRSLTDNQFTSICPATFSLPTDYWTHHLSLHILKYARFADNVC